MERNVTLDFVRGVAILGILLLNISAFGLPKADYLNPAWSGSATLSDAWTWGHSSTCWRAVSFSPCSRCCLAPVCNYCSRGSAGSSRG